MNNDAEVKNSVAEAENAPAQSGPNVPQNEVENESAKEVKNEPRKQRKFPSWIDLFALAGVFVFSALLGSVVFALCGGLDATTKPGWALPLYYTIQMLPPIIFVIWQRCKLGKGWGIHFGLGNLSAPLLMWGVVLLMASSVVIEPLLALFPAEDYNAVTDLVGKGAWSILSVVVCAPLFEEMLFRGLVFESCRERFGGGGAVLISALLFGLIHVVPVQVINAFVVGIILGFIYLRTRSLANVILLHAVNNALAYLTMGLEVDTIKELIPQAWLYWVIYGVAAVIFVLSMVKVFATLRANKELE